MNKKGFTLVELLAVVIVLAIISIIAVPQVLATIESARKSSSEKSMLGYIDAIDIHNAKPTGEDNYVLYENKEYDIKDIEVEFKGKKPTKGTVTFDEYGTVVKARLCISDYWVEYQNEIAKSTDKCN
mgnify:FL=1